MGRLKSETIGEDVISYYYDANGNRTLMNNDGNITSYTYDKNNRLLTESANGETITYTYDANGNTLSAGEKSYTYDYRGQQICYSDETTYAAYTYNPSGLRSVKTVGGSTKYFVYNGMQIVFEYEDSISDGTTYYYGLNRTHSSDGDIFIYNAHGDTVQLVNDNAVAASYTYDAFGNLINTVGTSNNAFLYCSEYFDSETETYYLRARYYNPANGRFTQQDAWAFMDPADPLTLNLYTYCGNNPVVYVDPSGHSFLLTLAIVTVAGAFIGAAVDAGTQLISNGGNLNAVNWRSVGASAVAGAVGGALGVVCAPAATTLGSAMVVGGAIGGAEYATYSVVSGSPMTVGGMAVSMGFGAVGAGIGYGMAQPKNGLLPPNAVTGSYTPESSSSDKTRVGRWMSQAEYDKMVETGRVQASYSGNNTTFVADPANPNAFGQQAKSGSIYVEFDVDSSRVFQGGNEAWGIIPGPGSIHDRLRIQKGLPGYTDMPTATNIQIVGSK